jgi:hypothetical protein
MIRSTWPPRALRVAFGHEPLEGAASLDAAPNRVMELRLAGE